MKLSSLVAGHPVSGGGSLQVLNPYNGSLVGLVRMATRDDLERAVTVAREFTQTPTRFQRADLLDKTRSVLEANRETFARLITSESGLAIRKPTERIPHTRVVGLELELPGTSEVIWASAEPRFHSVNAQTHFSGLHFVGMATKHERLIRDYVRERRERLLRLLAPRPIYVSRFGCRFS